MNRLEFLKSIVGAGLVIADVPSNVFGESLKVVEGSLAVNHISIYEKWKNLILYTGKDYDSGFFIDVVPEHLQLLCATELEQLERSMGNACFLAMSDNSENMISEMYTVNKWGKSYRFDRKKENIMSCCSKSPDGICYILEGWVTHPVKIVIPEIRKAWSPNYDGWLKWYDLSLTDDGEVIKIKRNKPRIDV